MDILQGVQYFYTSNGQQLGPVEGTELVALAEQGHITAADNIWSEGFTEWLPPQSFSQLAPLYQAQPEAPTPPAGLNASGVVHGAHIVKKHLHVKAAHRFREGAKFNTLIGLLTVGLILSAGTIAAVLLGPEPLPGAITPPAPLLPLWAMFLLSVGAVGCLLMYAILSLIYLSRAWAYIQELPVARTTPGKAVWLLFLPLFNIYWLFVAYGGWPTDYNKYLDMAGADDVPRAKPGLAMTYCVLAILGLPLLHPFVMSDMCKGINYLATAPKPEGVE